jgi:hypothetical protein
MLTRKSVVSLKGISTDVMSGSEPDI